MYKALIDRFDQERGDKLSFALDDATELAALPLSIAAPIVHGVLRWFTGEELKPIADSFTDPRDRALFLRLVTHQKQNAALRADYLASRRRNRLGKDMSTHDDISGEYKDRRESKQSISDSLDCHAAVASSAAGSSACALPADLPAQSGKTVLYFDGYLSGSDSPTHAMDNTTFKEIEPMVSRTIAEADFRSDPVSVILPCADFDEESDKAKFRNTLIARYKANPRQFMLVAWKYLAEAHNARIALVKAIRGKCAQCISPDDSCNDVCPHAYVKDRLADYAKNYGCEVFARNLCGRLKVLKTSKPKK